jgi:hypothetical protein
MSEWVTWWLATTSGPNSMSGSVIQIEVIDDLLTECITAMVVRIYGSLGTQWITGGQLRIVEWVLDGDLFSWGSDAAHQDDGAG